jgi:hypothetical protein
LGGGQGEARQRADGDVWVLATISPWGWVTAATVTGTTRSNCPLRTVTVPVPRASAAVSRPEPDTVRRSAGLAANVSGAPVITSPTASRTVAWIWRSRPRPIVIGSGPTVTAVGTWVTATTTWPVMAPDWIAMVVWPAGPTEVTSPVALTVAIVGLPDVKVSTAPGTGIPFRSRSRASS